MQPVGLWVSWSQCSTTKLVMIRYNIHHLLCHSCYQVFYLVSRQGQRPKSTTRNPPPPAFWATSLSSSAYMPSPVTAGSIRACSKIWLISFNKLMNTWKHSHLKQHCGGTPLIRNETRGFQVQRSVIPDGTGEVSFLGSWWLGSFSPVVIHRFPPKDWVNAMF